MSKKVLVGLVEIGEAIGMPPSTLAARIPELQIAGIITKRAIGRPPHRRKRWVAPETLLMRWWIEKIRAGEKI